MMNAEGLHALVDSCRADQQRRWEAGEHRLVEDYFANHPNLAEDKNCRLDLIYNEFCLQQRLGLNPEPEDYCRRFPEVAAKFAPCSKWMPS